jgi:hypothetical protein
MKVSSSTTIPTVMSSSIEGRGGLSLRERKTSSLSGGEEG